MKIKDGGEIAQCRTCMLSKIHVASVPQDSLMRSAGLLYLIHTDVCWPFKVMSFGGSKYYVSCIDDFSDASTSTRLKTKVQYSVSLKSSNCKWKNRLAGG